MIKEHKFELFPQKVDTNKKEVYTLRGRVQNDAPI